jgi:hypothetical protein
MYQQRVLYTATANVQFLLQSETSTVAADIETLSFAQVLPYLLAEDSAQSDADAGFLRFESV